MIYTVILLSLATAVRGFGSGAPEGACAALEPAHRGMTRVAAPSNYTITATPRVSPGGEVTVEIAGAPFRGYMIQAVLGNKIVGTFSRTGLVSCQNAGDTATHEDGNDKPSTTFSWKAPTNVKGAIYIRGTILEKFDTAFINVYSNKVDVL